jgi:hypothetical protein
VFKSDVSSRQESTVPKARLSPEEKIIDYFKTAPRDIAAWC